MIKNPHLCFKASAGTGKTFALTVRYLSLLFVGAKAHEILTLTFTNKAALQMDQRIFETLKNLNSNEIVLNEVSQQTNLSVEQIKQKQEKVLDEFIQAQRSIFTIDKFINKILRQFSGYSSVSDDFEINSDDMEKIGFEFLKTLDEKSFSTLLNFSHFSQKQFISLLEIFKDLQEKNEKLPYLFIEDQVIDAIKEEVLKEAFILKQMFIENDNASDRVKKMFYYNSFDEFIESSFLKYEKFEDHSWFKKAFNETNEKQYKVVREKLETFYRLQSQYNLNQLSSIYEKFKSFKQRFNRQKNYLTFSDIANLVFELLQDKIQSDFLYFRLDSTYNHILIDEFQDTSLLQYKILKPLIDEVFAGKGQSFKTFFYVGDIKQSIYRFRGGKSDLFDYLKVDFPKLEVKDLNTNYRSSEKIVSFVNEIFLKVPNYDMVHQYSKKDGGYVEVKGVEKDFGSTKEFEEILTTIEMLLSKGLDPNEIAILTYNNKDVLNIYNYLKEKLPTIDITTDMTSKLINANNVKAMINYIKYFYFNEDIYKANFNSLVDIDTQNEITYKINIKTNNLKQICYLVATHYKLFDQNMLKFLELLENYSDVVDFIYHVDNEEAIMENESQKGISILTIFKSKGLEFNTVLLVDRISKKTNDKSTLLFEYDGIKLDQVHYKIKNKEFFDTKFNEALEKEKILSNLDDLNVLYVALTRAENNMFIFKKDDEKQTAFAQLDLCEIGQLKIENSSENNNDEIIDIEYKPLNLGAQNKSASKASDKSELKAQYFGIATHYCLEMIHNFTIDSLDKSILLTRARYGNLLNDEDLRDVYRLVKELIVNEKFQGLISGYDLLKEQALSFNGEIKILDLIACKDDHVIVFDYKTTLEESFTHEHQVKEYMKALETIFVGKKIDGYILYLRDNKIKEVR